jgi:hypothetical protein
VISSERKILFGTVAALLIAFVFAPYQRANHGGHVVMTGWQFIWDLGPREAVNVSMLATTWVGILIVGGLLWYATKRSQ